MVANMDIINANVGYELCGMRCKVPSVRLDCGQENEGGPLTPAGGWTRLRYLRWDRVTADCLMEQQR